jgi:hypothetical protein
MKEKLLKIYYKKHNNFYDYALVNYINARTKIKIICPIHGIFYQLPNSHKKSGCMDCGKINRSNKYNIIEKFNSIHNNFYDYSDINYINNNTKVKIKCPIGGHGEFYQSPKIHLNGGGCNKCHIDSRKIDINEIINRGNMIHNNFYDYSMLKFNKIMDKVIIICPTHGTFSQILNNHINNKQGCMECKIESSRLDYRDFIKRSNLVHNNLYKYPSQHFDYNSNIVIKCPIHGNFNQLPNNHLNKGYGCSKCKRSKGEKHICTILENNKIKYETEYIFDGCKYIRNLRFDFYLPKYNICIEYNGVQHYEVVEHFGGEEALILNRKRDAIKRNFCTNSNINLVTISYKEDINIKILSILNKI